MLNSPLKVGVLLPQLANSQYSKVFHKSLQKSLMLEQDQFEIELMPVFCGRGELQKVVDGVNQLIDFHEADAIVALASYASISSAFSQIKQAKIPLIIANLGEHLIPLTEKNTPEGYMVSFNWWQDAIALGSFAAQNFKEGAIIGSIFEIGYAFSQCFQLGSSETDAEHKMATLTTSEELTNEEIFAVKERMHEYPPAYSFLLMQEACATSLLSELAKLDQLKEMTIFCLPHLYDTLNNEEHPFKVISTKQYLTNQESEFTAFFEELAQVVQQVLIAELTGNDEQSIQSALSEQTRTMLTDLQEDSLSFKRTLMGNELDQVVAIDLRQSNTLKEMRSSLVASWMNLYPFPS